MNYVIGYGEMFNSIVVGYYITSLDGTQIFVYTWPVLIVAAIIGAIIALIIANAVGTGREEREARAASEAKYRKAVKELEELRSKKNNSENN